MSVPKINTPAGRQPITVVPNASLLEAYMYSDACPEDKELARCLYFLGDLDMPGSSSGVLSTEALWCRCILDLVIRRRKEGAVSLRLKMVPFTLLLLLQSPNIVHHLLVFCRH